MVRLKNRYIVVEIKLHDGRGDNEGPPALRLHQVSIYQAIQNKVQQLHGDFGVAAIRAGFQAKYTNEFTNISIIRSRHGPHKLVTSVIPFITVLDGHRATVNILYVGASMKKCFSFVKVHQERMCDEFCARASNEDVKLNYRNVLMNMDNIIKSIKH